jgi:hypothetical protein
VADVLVFVDSLLALVLVVIDVPRSLVEDLTVVKVLSIDSVLCLVVEMTDTELVDCVEVGLGEDVVVAACEVDVVSECVVVVLSTTTPGLVVGIVTEVAGAVVASLAGKVFACVVACTLFAGHNADTIPPSRIIPNSVTELTETSEQALLTSWATEVNADSQATEHPLLKSDSIQVGI